MEETTPLNIENRVLVVDDEKGIRDLLSTILTKKFSIDFASCAEEALKKIKDAHSEGTYYSVVLTDYQMGRMSGLELIKEAKESGANGSSVYVMMTSYAGDQNLLRKLLAMRVYDCLPKPFEIHTIYSTLDEAIRRREEILAKEETLLEAKLRDYSPISVPLISFK